MTEIGREEQLINLLHDELCTRHQPCGFGQADSMHHKYYQEKAGKLMSRLEPEIGAANVVFAAQVFFDEVV